MKKIFSALVLLSLCAASQSWGFGFGFGFWPFKKSTGIEWIDLVQSLSWSTNSYEFGTHDAGTTTTATFTITNSGSDTAEDVATSVTGAGFRLYSSTTFGNISAGSARIAKVAFTPTGAGSFAGFANYSAPNIGRTSVALSGTGSGTPTGDCGTTPAISYSSGTTTDKGVSTSINRSRIGVFYSGATTYNMCAVEIQLKVEAGNVSSKNYVARVYSAASATSGLGALIATSEPVSGSALTSAFSYPKFTFSTPVNLTSNHVVLVMTADASVDGTNYAIIQYGAGIADWQSLHNYTTTDTHYETVGAKTYNFRLYTIQ